MQANKHVPMHSILCYTIGTKRTCHEEFPVARPRKNAAASTRLFVVWHSPPKDIQDAEERPRTLRLLCRGATTEYIPALPL